MRVYHLKRISKYVRYRLKILDRCIDLTAALALRVYVK